MNDKHKDSKEHNDHTDWEEYKEHEVPDDRERAHITKTQKSHLTDEQIKYQDLENQFNEHQADAHNPHNPLHPQTKEVWDDDLAENRKRFDPNENNVTGVNPNDTEAVIESQKRADHYFGEQDQTIEDTKEPLPENAGNSQAHDNAKIGHGFSADSDKIH